VRKLHTPTKVTPMQRALAIIFLVPLVVLARFAPTAHATQGAQPPAPYRLEREGPVAELSCERNFTTDRFGRKITFYLYIPEAAKATPLPLVVYVQGSGQRSVFGTHPKTGKPVSVSGHATIPQVLKGRAVTLVVEKPTIEFLDPGLSDPARLDAYAKEHTPERWAEAIGAAIRATQESSAVKRGQVLVVGHSEGGQVACRVARDLPGIVTHVACASGGGPTFLYDILSLARSGAYFGEVSDKPEERVEYVLEEWRKIQADPTNTEKKFFGHSYRYWAAFLPSSPMELLDGVDAKVYIAQGTTDRAVDPATADMLYAHLLAQGKHPVYDRVEGADHSFQFDGDQPRDGWTPLYGRIVDWFLKP
jgi:pimeloyl-ACP methyl ester carboxylesterase